MPGVRDDGLRDDDLVWLLGQGWNGHLPAEIATRRPPARAVGKRIGIAGMIAIIAAVTIVAMPRPSMRWNTGSGTARPSGNQCQGAQHTAGGADSWGGCWPGAWNTGVPAGTSLTTYGGSCTITADNTTIDSKTVNCASLSVQAGNFTLKNSLVNGIVRLDTDLGGSSAWTMTIQDSEVDAGQQQLAVTCCGNMTVLRTNMHGGITGAQCEETATHPCSVTDSWIHGQYIPDDQPWHLGGFLSDGSSVGITLNHNMVVCDHAVNSVGEGCTGDINLIPNFAAISGATIYRNLLGANIGSAWCTLGGEKPSSPTPHSNNIVYQENVFQRGSNGLCAEFGAATDFDINQPGNQWTGNKWDDGVTVPTP